MTLHINMSLDQMGARLSHERRVAVPFYRDERKVGCLQFEASGPVLKELPIESFDRNFTKRHEEPVLSVVLKLVGAVRTCYLPGSRVLPTLMEMFNMAITNGSGDLTSLSQAQLTEHYNQLATAAQRPTVKGFKDKATALKRIKDLEAEASEPNEAQKRRAQAQAEKEAHANDNAFNKHLAAKRAAKAQGEAAAERGQGQSLADVPPASRRPAAKKAAAKKVAAKKAAPAKKVAAKKAAPKAEGEKKPRGRGIGNYACEMILKGKSNEEVVKAVLTKFPDASTSASSVAWYRNKLKNEGKL